MNTAGEYRLDGGRIRKAMRPQAESGLRQLTILKETDSTNNAVLRLPGQQQHAHAVVADRQTRGRGRRQRSWHSPAGGNVYLSLGWWFRETKWPLSTLPLLVAICVCRALTRVGLQGHGIKWPNDILVDGEKLAGILVELQSAGNGPALAVIGIGLNVRMPPADPEELEAAIDRPWTDLESRMGPARNGISRNLLLAYLLDELLESLDRFEREGFEGFTAEWRERDLLLKKEIRLEQDGQYQEGVARGVDANGGLILETANEGRRVFHSGEVSVQYG
jgi:BirA family biotin operon repressor/biotin-[acetyl-CoA-carboxylase] ligase